MDQKRAEEDRILAVKAQAGDLNAEEELLRRYKGLARKKANMYYMVGADEDDVLQEGMIGLLKAVRRFDPQKDASFQTFAGICITTQIISAIRAADRNKHKALNTSVSLNSSLPSAADADGDAAGLRLEDTLKANSADGPEKILLIKDIVECILHNDDKVFSPYEMQVLMERIRGKSREQIAESLGKSVTSVDNSLQRARRKIIAYLVT